MASNSVFLSPGVYTSEKDLSFVQRQVGVTTLGLVGETTKGPAFQPIFITNYDEFKTFFGGLNPEKFKANGIPKYELPYIAKSYLSEANQAFVTRVLGLSGYDAKLAWGITMDAALDISTSGTTDGGTSYTPLFTFTASTAGTITTISSSSSLLQTIFNTGGLNSQLNFLSSAATGATATITPTFIKGSETAALFSGISFTLRVNSSTTVGSSVTGSTSGVTTHYSGTSYSDVENKLVALLRSRGVYDGSENLNVELSASTQLNISQSASTVQTSPLATFKLTGTSNTQGAFEYSVSMDSTSKNYIARVLGETSQDAKPATYVEEIFQSMFDTYVADGKVRGINMTLIDYSNKFKDYKTEYSPAVTPYVLSEVRGNTLLKLFRMWTISDGETANSEIKISIANIKPDDKTFDIVIRSFSDTDANPSILEKFSNCTMDTTSNNFVGRKIGTLDGQFPSNSNFILIELDEDADTTDAFPAGFMGYPVRDYTSNGNSSVATPSMSYKTTYDSFEKKRKFYLGVSDTEGIDADFFDYKGVPTSGPSEWTGLTKGFHLDSGATSTTIADITNATFAVGNAEFRSDAGVVGTDYEQIIARKFTLVPAGGFDGWDIYRTSRTNTDTYAINGTKGALGLTNTNFAAKALTTGENGTTADYYAYFEALRTFSNPEAVNINVFVTPGIDTTNNSNLVEEAIEMIETERGDSFYIVTTPDVDAAGALLDVSDVVDNLSGQFDSNYTATYFPWVQVNDAENNQYIYLPATRDVVRNIALTDNIAFPWYAVAGIQRGDVDAIKARVKLTESQRDTLYEGRINPITTFSSEGVKIWGNKTLQVKDSALNRINVRRLLLQARKLISAVSVRLLFEQNDDIVRNQFLSLVNPILDNIRKERGLYDFRVVVENSPEDFERNQLTGKIYIKPTKSLEFVAIEFNVMPTGASFDNV
jgi:hypothetical protein